MSAPYVIRRNEDGAYVTPPGSQHSYTKDLRKARLFNTREEAERDKCGNETIASALGEIGGGWEG